MTDDQSNVISLEKRRSESAANEARLLSDAIRNGFNHYRQKYVGRRIDDEMIFELCRDICVDALKAMRENERNPV